MTTFQLFPAQIAEYLVTKHGIQSSRAGRIVEIAQEFGNKTTTVVIITRMPHSDMFTVDETAKRVSSPAGKGYNPVKTNAAPPRKGSVMARGKAAADVEPDTERDVTVYLEKEPTVKMQDFHEWLEDVLGIKMSQRDVALAITLHGDFQRSEFNRTRTAERREARAAGNGAAEPEATEEAPKGARRGRPKTEAKAPPKAKAPAKRGRPKAGVAPY